jgi:hypothetical protein
MMSYSPQSLLSQLVYLSTGYEAQFAQDFLQMNAANRCVPR